MAATLLSEFETNIAWHLKMNEAISTTTKPVTKAQLYQLIYDFSERLSRMCAEFDSSLGQKNGVISLTDGTSQYTDFCSDFISSAGKGWLLKTYSRDEIPIANTETIIDYSPSSSNETEPCEYTVGPNGEINFYQTPDDSYTFYLPYWYHQSKPTAATFTASAITKANPCAITTSASHCLQTGDRVYISGETGMTQLNGLYFTVTKTGATTFTLNGINSTSYSVATPNATISVVLPFNGAFDDLIMEYCVMRILNRDEYQMPFEQAWFQNLMIEARKIIIARKDRTLKVCR